MRAGAGPGAAPAGPRLGIGGDRAHPFAPRPYGQPRPHLAPLDARVCQHAFLPGSAQPHGHPVHGVQPAYQPSGAPEHLRRAQHAEARRQRLPRFRRVGALEEPARPVLPGRWRRVPQRQLPLPGDNHARSRRLAHLPVRAHAEGAHRRRSRAGAYHAHHHELDHRLRCPEGVPCQLGQGARPGR